MKVIALVVSTVLLLGCSTFEPAYKQGLQIGSVTSKNLFIDPSQFANRKVKLRLRNSSGDPSLDINKLKSVISNGLVSAGYEIVDRDFGIVIDVNAYQLQAVATGNVRNNSGIGLVLGGVAGYEGGRRPGGITAGSGAILGAVAGYALEEIIRAQGEYATYLALCDVNIGVVRKEFTKKDRFMIGGNKIEHKEKDEEDTFTNFALRDTLKVAVYAGDRSAPKQATIDALVDRLGRIVANLI